MNSIWRKDFPILTERVNDRPLIYLDSAATSQKPQIVLDTVRNAYMKYNANVYRGIHTLSRICTENYEESRKVVKYFIHAKENEEIIFVRGATEAINLVASGMAQMDFQPDDVILTTGMEHHSNFVPWQNLCQRKGCRFQVVPVTETAELDMDALGDMLDEHVKLLAVTQVSNVLGTVNPLEKIIAKAHACGALVFVDGTQAVQHSLIDVCKLDCDFFCFSGHKMYAPLGIGVLYGKKHLLEKLPPYQFGGEMVDVVQDTYTTYQPLPIRFEAGTPNYIGAVGLKTAIEYLQQADFPAICRYETELIEYARCRLQDIAGVHVLGNPAKVSSVVSFALEGIHHYDAALILDKLGIAIRSGNHCAQPLLRRFGLDGILRMSVACYNTYEDIEKLCDGISFVRKFLKK